MAKKYENIVCLGSSFAAGPGIPPIIDGNASRSGENYAHQIAKKYDARLTDLSVSGATLENIISESQAVNPSITFPPQIEGVPQDADLIFLTAGGNDMSYIGNMMKQAIRSTWIGWFLFLILSLFPIPKPVEITQEQLVERLGNVLDAIHQRAPKARVLLVEYLALLGEEEDENSRSAAKEIGFTPEQENEHRQKAERLVNAYAQAAKSRSIWCQVVPIHKESQKDHSIGSEQPWVTGFKLYDVAILRKVPFHPTLAGMTATAERISRFLESTSI